MVDLIFHLAHLPTPRKKKHEKQRTKQQNNKKTLRNILLQFSGIKAYSHSLNRDVTVLEKDPGSPDQSFLIYRFLSLSLYVFYAMASLHLLIEFGEHSAGTVDRWRVNIQILGVLETMNLLVDTHVRIKRREFWTSTEIHILYVGD